MYYEKFPGYFSYLYLLTIIDSWLYPRKNFIENYELSNDSDRIQELEMRNRIRKASYYTKLINNPR